MTTPEMINELREMQKQVIHGPTLFGEVADRLEQLQKIVSGDVTPVQSHAQPDGTIQQHPPK